MSDESIFGDGQQFLVNDKPTPEFTLRDLQEMILEVVEPPFRVIESKYLPEGTVLLARRWPPPFFLKDGEILAWWKDNVRIVR